MGRLRIDSYDLPQVEERPISGPNIPTEQPLAAFGGGEVAQEASNQTSALGNDVAQRAQATYRDEYKNAIQLQGLEIANQLTQEETRAKNALAQVKGKNALAARDQTLQDYDKFYTSLTQNIQNPDVKMLAQEHYAQRRNTLDSWATPYANGQVEEYDNNELLSSIKNEADSAATDPSPANVAVSVMSQKLAIAEFGQRNGRGEEWIKAKQLEASSATHLEALKAIVNAHQDITAREFFDRNKGEFVGNDVARAEELIKAGSSLAEAMRVRDTIFSITHEEVKGKDGQVSIKTTQPPITEAQVRDRLNELTKGMDPETRLRAEQLSFAQWAQEKQIQAAAQNDAFVKANDILVTTGDPTKIPLDLYLSLKPQDQEWLSKRAVEMAKPLRAEDDPVAYNNWKSIPDDAKANMTKKEFAELVNSGKFTTKTLEKFSDEVEALRRSEDRHAFKWSHEDTNKVFQAAQQAGILSLTGSDRLGTLKGEKNLEVMKFLKNAEAAFYSEANGKPMKPEEKDKVIDRLILDQGYIQNAVNSRYHSYARFQESFRPLEADIRPSFLKEVRDMYPNASNNKIRRLYEAREAGISKYGFKILGEQLK